MRNTILLWLSILFYCFGEYPSQSQHVTPKMDLQYLEYLISNSIDTFRLNQNLDPLLPDSFAYLLASNQSQFLSNAPSLTHEQPLKNKKTLSQRAKFFKTHYTSVYELFTRMTIFDSTYIISPENYNIELIAKEIFYQLFTSSSNKAILQTKNLKYFAAAFSFNETSRELNLCIIAANAPDDYTPSPCISCFPYIHDNLSITTNIPEKENGPVKIILPWNLKVPPSQKSMLAYKRYLQQIPKIEMAHQNDSLFIRMGTVRNARKFFKKRHDGLCMEIVPFDIYNCNKDIYYNTPGRRNGKAVFDGMVNKPVYKKTIFKSLYTSSHLSKQDFVVHMASAKPTDEEDLLEMNLVFIKKNRIVGIVPSVSRCGEPILTYSPALPLLDISQEIKAVQYKPVLRSDTLKLFIPFAWNEYYIDSLYLKLIKYKISRTDFEPDSVRINSFASVEGNLEINSNLYQKRAAPIVELLNQNGFPKKRIVTLTTENWDLFKQQLIALKDSNLITMNHDSLQKWVNSHFDSLAVNNLLKTQRYTYVWIKFSEKVTNSNIDSFAYSEFNRLLNLSSKNILSGKWQNIPTRIISRMEVIQKFVFQRILEGKTPLSVSKNMLDPENYPAILNPNFKRQILGLLYNQAAFESHSSGEDNQKDYLKFLELYLDATQAKPEAIYNYHVLMIRTHPFPSASYLALLKRHIGILEKSKFAQALITNLELYYHHHFMAMIATSGPFAEKSQAAASLRFLYNYYIKLPLSDELRLSLSRNYWYFEWDKQALAFLEPIITIKDLNHEALILSIKIRYTQIKLNPSNEDIQILLDAGNRLTPNEWCMLFTDFCRLNFQLLNNEPLYQMYCELKKKEQAK